MIKTKSYLSALGLVCPLGSSKQQVAKNLLAGDSSGMQPVTGWIPETTAICGVVNAPLPPVNSKYPWQNSRNNQLLLAATEQIMPELDVAIVRYGKARIAVIIGTSTSGIYEAGLHITELHCEGVLPQAFDYRRQELGDPALFLSHWLDLSGPSYSISTACTSSARALISAKRMLQAGLCDAVICGGSDSLCHLTLNGFSSLEAVSTAHCNPFSKNRQGINIGEAAVVFLLTRELLHDDQPTPVLAGVGASSDAYHISAPQPEGEGAVKAMQLALADAQLVPEQISYINLHGTATQHNDSMESAAVNQLFGAGKPCSSTKPLTGHTLGAAGALEAAFCWLAMQGSYNPSKLHIPHVWDGAADAELAQLNLCKAGHRFAQGVEPWLMSNSFAFGGNNTSLILGF
ncbi:beta-ketoacyl-[acyl-carrier-protein] synthase family protein [Thiopseudomonas acetoxidans]|uniref:Beta-ketoacyl-[acyl-carrier-protein] synthase family protein n=1 Tax=Thiopseudomonas acetoxidans TaxID=3041622 RepID=A0ABT7SMZ8_9GAMM|nr:beta-ketoacyl-[acyl-carrier-protein] synthase family protein [Thiopseudomonas sp. CY1220]MDM7857550.1 beta-ketoacyl-[acyl-carrier-protein] synthase family protein [Thiopseudomonas sp. CY1220]